MTNSGMEIDRSTVVHRARRGLEVSREAVGGAQNRFAQQVQHQQEPEDARAAAAAIAQQGEGGEEEEQELRRRYQEQLETQILGDLLV
eukprot:COSAG05_NODE_1995_length_3729_cov_4.415427_2_plen_88_part_00